MPTGNRRMRAAPGFALGLVVAMTAGCRGVPSHRLDPALFPHRGPIEAPSTSMASVPATGTPPGPDAPRAALSEPEDRFAALPALPPLRPVNDAEALPPTPLLDAALRRAEAARRSVVEDVAGPEPPAAPRPIEPAVVGPKPAEAADPPARPEVAAGPATDRPGAGQGPEPTGDAWEEGLGRLRRVARERAEAPGGSARDWSVRERILAGLAEADTAGAGGDVRGAVLASLDAGDGGRAAGGPGPEAARAEVPEKEAPLEIADLRPCRRVRGFGEVESWGDGAFRPGQALILYSEVVGLRYEPDGDLFRSRVAASLALIPEGRGEPAWEDALGTAEDACRRRRRDYFVSYRIRLPATLPPGPYQLRLTQTDLADGRSTSRAIPLTIRP